jgi:hypothetical protein
MASSDSVFAEASGRIALKPILDKGKKLAMDQTDAITFVTLNRSAVLLIVQKPFLDWVNHLMEKNGRGPQTLEALNRNQDVFLTPDFETPNEIKDYVSAISPALFETKLEEWCENEESWPKDRTLEMFWQWFEIDIHKLVIETEDFDEDEDEEEEDGSKE